MMLNDPRLPERFWVKVTKAQTGCWVWLGNRSKQGYGRFHFEGRLRPPHRIAYEALVGPIADDLVCDHLCRNPSCVNPAHIQPVSIAENTRRGRTTNSEVCRRGLHPWPESAAPNGGSRPTCRKCRQMSEARRRAARRAALLASSDGSSQ